MLDTAFCHGYRETAAKRVLLLSKDLHLDKLWEKGVLVLEFPIRVVLFDSKTFSQSSIFCSCNNNSKDSSKLVKSSIFVVRASWQRKVFLKHARLSSALIS